MPNKQKQNQNQDSGDEYYRKKRDRNNQVMNFLSILIINVHTFLNHFLRLPKDPDLSPNKKLKKRKVVFRNL